MEIVLSLVYGLVWWLWFDYYEFRAELLFAWFLLLFCGLVI